jgi:predicted nucleotidyltransferase
MSDIDPARFLVYKRAAQERQQQLREQIQMRIALAWRVARQAAEILRVEFQVEKIVAFGSLVHPELFHQHSDVDLAVWNLDERLYFRAVGRLQSLDPQIGVDLILFIEAKATLQEVILRDGVVL